MILRIGQRRKRNKYGNFSGHNATVEQRHLIRQNTRGIAWPSLQGFTLIELAVVLVVIGVIAIFTVPYFGGFTNRTRLDSACRDWVAYANYARSQAVMQGVNYRLTCDLDQQRYWLTYENVSTGIAGQYTSSGDRWGQPVSLDSTVRFVSIQLDQNQPQESGVVTISFTPRGTSNDVMVIFSTRDNEQRQITISGITGLATIQATDTAI
ncbi:MAG: GspH/FimT family pseudopilin [bacterium]|nr:GspH/FimT family pseudopilin [bacterium]